MKRKIVKQAGSAFTITLPINWIRDFGLKEGDEIDIFENENSLIVQTFSKKISSIEIDLTSKDELLCYKIINAIYAKGYDEISIIGEPKLFGKILGNLGQNLGFLVVFESKNKLLIKDVSGINYENLDEIFKQLFSLLSSFCEKVIRSIFDKTGEIIGDNFDQEINKFSLFLQRAIVKQSYSDSKKGKVIFGYSYGLEKIGDEITRFYREAENLKFSLKEKDLAMKSLDSIRFAFEIFQFKNLDRIDDLYILRNEFRKKLKSILNKSPLNAFAMYRLLRVIEEANDLSHFGLMNKY